MIIIIITKIATATITTNNNNNNNNKNNSNNNGKNKKMEMVGCPSLGPPGEQQRGVGAGIGRCCHQSHKLQTKALP